LKDLQASKGFNLMCVFDGNDENFSMMCPDVILPSVGLLYKTNIFYIDLDKDMSYLHLYDKNSSKIITYSFQGTTKSPSKIWKYKTFLKKNENFKNVSNLCFIIAVLKIRISKCGPNKQQDERFQWSR
jgi:hypothetical protein